MARKTINEMLFAKVYPMLIGKAERKERTRKEVDQITTWHTGYTSEELESMLRTEITYEEFFNNAPNLNPNRHLIKGKICGVNIAEIEDPIMREVRYLDKMIDELAKGKSMEKILRK
ncbi:MAG: DUF2200 domain-containing protein [Gemella sp.]|nr:DUF2200 domain-containing protein [Gemella sp.]